MAKAHKTELNLFQCNLVISTKTKINLKLENEN